MPLDAVEVAFSDPVDEAVVLVRAESAPVLEAEEALAVAVELARYSVKWSMICSCKNQLSRKLTLAELVAEADDTGSILGAADSVGAVPDAVAEVHVAAKAGNVSSRAAERLSLTKHVVHTELL